MFLLIAFIKGAALSSNLRLSLLRKFGAEASSFIEGGGYGWREGKEVEV